MTDPSVIYQQAGAGKGKGQGAPPRACVPVPRARAAGRRLGRRATAPRAGSTAPTRWPASPTSRIGAVSKTEALDISRGELQRSALQGGLGGRGRCGDFGRRLLGENEFQFSQEQLEVSLRLGIALEHQLAPVGGRNMHVDHLHARKFVEHRARCEPGCEGNRRGRRQRCGPRCALPSGDG